MNADKNAQRHRLIEERQNLPNRLDKAADLQHALRAFLLGRSDDVIGAYWPIKGEFDALPALYRWQEDALLGAALSSAQRLEAKPWGPHHAVSALPSHVGLPAGPMASRRKIGLPVVDKARKTLEFHAWWPGCPMANDAYDIPKPVDTEIVTPTLLLVPCVGFTAKGFRLGYGGGFYDRTLAAAAPKPFAVGLAFAHGFVSHWVPEPHDVALDAILTDQGQVWPA
jgi:5-formyltetrahydrofolate cyclo-ligase